MTSFDKCVKMEVSEGRSNGRRSILPPKGGVCMSVVTWSDLIQACILISNIILLVLNCFALYKRK